MTYKVVLDKPGWGEPISLEGQKAAETANWIRAEYGEEIPFGPIFVAIVRYPSRQTNVAFSSAAIDELENLCTYEPALYDFIEEIRALEAMTTIF